MRNTLKSSSPEYSMSKSTVDPDDGGLKGRCRFVATALEKEPSRRWRGTRLAGAGVAVTVGVGAGVATAVGVGEGTGAGIGVGVAVGTGSAVAVSVGVGMTCGVGVAVGIAVGVAVAVGNAVGVGLVGDATGIDVAVCTGVGVGVGTGDGSGVGTGDGVGVGADVGVGTGVAVSVGMSASVGVAVGADSGARETLRSSPLHAAHNAPKRSAAITSPATRGLNPFLSLKGLFRRCLVARGLHCFQPIRAVMRSWCAATEPKSSQAWCKAGRWPGL